MDIFKIGEIVKYDGEKYKVVKISASGHSLLVENTNKDTVYYNKMKWVNSVMVGKINE
jgi:hypothetical protein